jgi:hypothetical protein
MTRSEIPRTIVSIYSVSRLRLLRTRSYVCNIYTDGVRRRRLITRLKIAAGRKKCFMKNDLFMIFLEEYPGRAE